MKILVIYRHYSPDTAPYARVLRMIAENSASQGHDVTVYTGQPSYNRRHPRHEKLREVLGGVTVRRLRLLPERRAWRALRLVNYAYFLARAVIHALTTRYDRLIGNSHPPIAMGCALRLIHILRGVPYIYHCQDLHPEAAAVIGDVRNQIAQKLLCALDTTTCRCAAQVVAISSDMAGALEARDVSRQRVVVIENAASKLDHAPSVSTIDAITASNVPRFLFAGNLGRFQGLERILEAARRTLDCAEFQLILMGEGAVKQRLVKLAGEFAGRQILFLPRQSEATAHAAMRACDYGIVSLVRGLYPYAYPSKVASYLSAGCPLFVAVEPQSELARMTVTHNLGYVAPTSSVDDIARTFHQAIDQRDQWTPARREGIAKFAARRFGESRMLAAWDHLLDQQSAEAKCRAAA